MIKSCCTLLFGVFRTRKQNTQAEFSILWEQLVSSVFFITYCDCSVDRSYNNNNYYSDMDSYHINIMTSSHTPTVTVIIVYHDMHN